MPARKILTFQESYGQESHETSRAAGHRRETSHPVSNAPLGGLRIRPIETKAWLLLRDGPAT